jgi:pimeloyl-ACP methyl ester carboxylesterase
MRGGSGRHNPPRTHPTPPNQSQPTPKPPPAPPIKSHQVDDHLLLDLPTVVAAVVAATGSSQIHWVGHSMGGMLAVGAISRGLPCAAAFKSVTLVASGCFGAGSWHALAAPFVKAVTRAGFFAGHIVRWATGLRGPLRAVAWGTEALFYVHGNVRPEVARKLVRSCLSFIPSGVVKQVGGWVGGGGLLRRCESQCTAPTFAPTPNPTPHPPQFMGSLNTPLGISSADGGWNYADPKALGHDARPVMGVNGDSDLFCPAAGGARGPGGLGFGCDRGRRTAVRSQSTHRTTHTTNQHRSQDRKHVWRPPPPLLLPGPRLRHRAAPLRPFLPPHRKERGDRGVPPRCRFHYRVRSRRGVGGGGGGWSAADAGAGEGQSGDGGIRRPVIRTMIMICLKSRVVRWKVKDNGLVIDL